MKKLLPFIFLLCFQFTNAQIGGLLDGIKKAVDSAAEDLGEALADKAIEELFERILEGDGITFSDSTSTNSEKDSSSFDLSTLGGLFSSEEVDKQFDFDYELITDMTSTSKKGETDTHQYIYLLPKTVDYIGMKMDETVSIYDYRDGKLYSIIDGKVVTFKSKAMMEALVGKAYAKQTTFEETDEYDNIAGKRCRKYTFTENDGTVTHTWLAKDFVHMNENFITEKWKGEIEYANLVEDNYPLKTEIEETDGSKTKMETTQIIQKKATIDLSKY